MSGVESMERLNRRYPSVRTSGKAIRLGRLIDVDSGRGIILPLSHSLFLGPDVGWENADSVRRAIRSAMAGGATAFVMSPGMLSICADEFVGRGAPGLVIQLDWTNMWRDQALQLGYAEGRNTAIATVEQAARMGADGIMSYLFIGLDDPAAEAAQIDMNARISRACEENGIIRILEPMARGHRVGDEMFRSDYVRLHTRMAAEIGADIIKTDYTGDPESYRTVVDGCPLPIFVAGGPRTNTIRDTLQMVADVIQAGAMGLLFGRKIVQAENPQAMTAAMARIVYHDASVDEAMDAYAAAAGAGALVGGPA